MNISFALHIIGLALWVGGLMLLSRFMKSLATSQDSGRLSIEATYQVKKVFYRYVITGFVLSLLTGLYQIFAGPGLAVYMKQGWFHGKLPLLFLLIVATAMLAFEVNKAASGGSLYKGRLVFVHAAAAFSLLAMPVLMYLVRLA
jgi:uncharacterized membrane protein